MHFELTHGLRPLETSLRRGCLRYVVIKSCRGLSPIHQKSRDELEVFVETALTLGQCRC